MSTSESPPVSDPIKQVIVLRHDLHMRLGKAVAQGAHASMMFLVSRIYNREALAEIEGQWIMAGMRKICVRVDSLEELKQVEAEAEKGALQVHVITDSGRTEFHGEPTVTALAVGPDYSSKIDTVTGRLKLL